jgi:1-acyl-sn-glycerol-3-phosphate acyltransferase
MLKGPDAGELLLSTVAHALERTHLSVDPRALDNWSPRRIKQLYGILRPIYTHYFRATVQGAENIPAGACMLTGVHGGGIISPDLVLTAMAFYESTNFERPLYGLAHRLFFYFPLVNRFMAELGALEGNRETARELLRKDHAFMVFPGGEYDVSRPWRRRNEVDFHGRKGFVRVALDTGAPIVPFGAVGGEGTWIVLSQGRVFAKALGLERLFRLHTFPLSLNLPWGLTLGYLPFVPLPARLKVAFGEPMYFKATHEERTNPYYLAYVRDTVQARVRQLVNDLEKTDRGEQLNRAA